MAQSLASREFLGMKNPMAHYIPLWVLVVFSFLSLIIIVYAGQHDFGKVEVNDLDVNGTLSLSQGGLSLGGSHTVGGNLTVNGTTTATGRLSLGSQAGLDLQSLLGTYLPAGAVAGVTAATANRRTALAPVGRFITAIQNTDDVLPTGSGAGTGDEFIRQFWGNTTEDYLAILALTGNVPNTAFTGLTAGLNFYKATGATGAGTTTVTLPAATAGQTIVIVLTVATQAVTEVLEVISPAALDDNSISVDCSTTALAVTDKAAAGNDRLRLTANGGATTLEGYIIAVPTGTTYQIIHLEGVPTNSVVIFA